MKTAKPSNLKILFFVYIIILFRITVFRSDFTLTQIMQNGTVNITLFQDYIPLIKEGRWFRFLYLFVGNIIWFIPFGAALLISGKASSPRKAALYGLMLSLMIETLQYLFGTGISELDDLLLNTLGTWLGAAISCMLNKPTDSIKQTSSRTSPRKKQSDV